MDNGFEKIDTAIDSILAEKADNILFDEENSTIQLTANGMPVGEPVYVCTNTGLGITDMKITLDGELLVFFDNDSVKNLGKVVGNDGMVYVPHIDEHKILTFTQEKDPAEPPSADLNPNDEWGEIVENGVVTDYVWENIEPAKNIIT